MKGFSGTQKMPLLRTELDLIGSGLRGEPVNDKKSSRDEEFTNSLWGVLAISFRILLLYNGP